ncbi:MAG: LysR family transcriptional regulator [bacterium]
MKTIHLKNIDLNLLLIFDCIYQEGSITEAGDRLDRTQSAVSHALERLRNLFDDPLFVRTANRMRPTPRAQQLAGPIQMALKNIQDILILPDRFSPEKLERTFIISMSDYCETVILPSLMRKLSRQAPAVRIEVLAPATSEPQQGLESGAFDLIIGNKDVSTGIFQQKLFDDEFICMVSNDHSGIGEELTLETYVANPHIIFAPSGKKDRLEKSLRKQGIKRHVVLQVPHILVIPQILKGTPYLVTLPRKLAEALDITFLRMLKPPMKLPGIPVMQYWHEAMNNDPAHRWLRKTVHGSMAGSGLSGE